LRNNYRDQKDLHRQILLPFLSFDHLLNLGLDGIKVERPLLFNFRPDEPPRDQIAKGRGAGA
jgi:hypothetical protein